MPLVVNFRDLFASGAFTRQQINTLIKLSEEIYADASVTPWGSITGTITAQTDLMTLLAGYATDAELLALLTASITNGDVTHAPSGDAVFDALALKQDSIPWTTIGGTADALTANYTPDFALSDGKMFRARGLLANATTAPTLVVDANAPFVIVKKGSAVLAAGDIAGPDHELLFVCHDYFTHFEFELINPATDATGGGGGGGSGESVIKAYTQAAHGFSVGMPVYRGVSGWAQTDRDSDLTACDALVSAQGAPLSATYATWNPSDKDSLITLSDGNLTANRGTSADLEKMVRATIALPTGKSYFEIRNPGVPIGTNSIWGGITNLASGLSGQFPGSTISGFGCQLTDATNFLYYNGSGGGSMRHAGYPTALSTSWFHYAIDISAGKLWVKHSNSAGVWAGGGDPVAGTSPTATFPANSVLYPAVALYTTSQAAHGNFGATAFNGVVPSGFNPGVYTPGVINDFTITQLGLMTLTTAQWDARTGDTGGLSPGEIYWTHTVTGGLTKTQPTSGFAQQLGRAESATVMRVAIGPVFALAGSLVNGYAIFTTTLNPSDKSADITLSGGNLVATKSAAGDAWRAVRATKSRYGGKWYFEVVVTAASTANSMIGLGADIDVLTTFIGGGTGWGGLSWFSSGSQLYRGNVTSVLASGYVVSDVVQVAYDADAQKLWLGRNGAWLDSGDPGAGIKASMTGVWPGLYPALSIFTGSSGITLTARFARAALTYTPPTGFAPWDND